MNLRMTALLHYGKWKGRPVVIKKIKVQKTMSTENVPTEQEYEVLMAYLKEKNPRFHLMVYILAHTGARISELLHFKMEDILSGEVTLDGKGGKYRRFFFTADTQKLARVLVASGAPATGPLCLSRYGVVLTDRGFSTTLKSLGRQAGVRKEVLHPHAFRHFFAKMYLKRSKDVVQLAEILGHASVDTTRIYLQKSLEEQRREYKRMVNW